MNRSIRISAVSLKCIYLPSRPCDYRLRKRGLLMSINCYDTLSSMECGLFHKLLLEFVWNIILIMALFILQVTCNISLHASWWWVPMWCCFIWIAFCDCVASVHRFWRRRILRPTVFTCSKQFLIIALRKRFYVVGGFVTRITDLHIRIPIFERFLFYVCKICILC